MSSTAVETTDLVVAYEFAKGRAHRVRAYIQPYRGKLKAHIRLFNERNGELRFTDRGIAVDLDDVPELFQAVAALAATAWRMTSDHNTQQRSRN